jgi:hypothetical protein
MVAFAQSDFAARLYVSRHSHSLCVSTDLQICAGEGLLLGFKVEASAAVASAVLYDGFSTLDRRLIGYISTVGEGNLYSFVHPLPFMRGIYLDNVANVGFVFVHWVLWDDLGIK